MRDPHSPTLRLRRLAAELKQGREKQKLTVTQAGKALGWTASKISKIETTETRRIVPADLDRLMDLYEITDPQKREAMQALARDAKERGWWSRYKDVFKDKALPDFEAEASVIRVFAGMDIPGLLQTPRYAEEVLKGGRYFSPEEVGRRLEFRLARRDILTRFDPVHLRTIIDESAVRRLVGGPDVMIEQLKYLLAMAQLPNIDVQVLPFEVGAHAGMAGSFSILEFPEPLDTPIVHVGTVTDSVFFEQPDDIHRFNVTFGDIQGSALSAARSATFIEDVVKSLESAQ
ncbi:helix-turn-helix domain-containing protein [Nocardiopsis potens]|uniref:helix-turn-helix domain-containing protein n=1 Tax=Nocardiopsis potens TaxID=1246458 RepID=UPI00036E953B|nr:helix-turn-helix transcriptional regulator [Nocardiopsis potens]